MENKSHALMAGLFMIVLSIALALAILWFDRDTSERLPYVLTTKASVSGLSRESAVRYRGLNVGKVVSIDFDAQVPGQILVSVSIEKGTPITRSTYATLDFQGVTGLAYVQFDDDGSSHALLETSDARVARIEIRPGMFDRLAGDGRALMVQLDEITRRANELLGPENQRMVRQTLQNLDATAAVLGRLGPRLEPTLDQLPGMVVEGRNALVSVNGMAGNFSRMASDYDAVANRLQQDGGLLDRMRGSLDQLDRAAEGVRSVTEQVNGDVLPQVGQLVEESARGVRAVGQAADRLSEQPQSLLIGDPKIPPGPGESGYPHP